MKQPITLQWENTCTTSNPTATSIQRCMGVNFSHRHAQVEEIARGNEDGLDPINDTGWYIDHDTQLNQPYCYKIITHREGDKAASPVTEFIHCVDYVNDIGYTGGTPERSMTFNIKIPPILHIDSQRLHGVSGKHNDIIKDPGSVIRHNNMIESLFVTGSPLLDYHDQQDTSYNILCKATTTNNLANTTENLKNTSIAYNVCNDIEHESYTVFSVVYNGYTTDTSSNYYSILPCCDIMWHGDDINISLSSGKKKSKYNKDVFTIHCIRSNGTRTTLWVNGQKIYNRKHAKNKNKCSWSSKKSYDLLPNHNKNLSSGICEYMIFSESLDQPHMNTITQYLSNRYLNKQIEVDLKDTQ